MRRYRFIHAETVLFVAGAVSIAFFQAKLIDYWGGLTNGAIPSFPLSLCIFFAGVGLTLAVPITSLSRIGLSGARRMTGLGLTALLLALWIVLWGRWYPPEEFRAGFDVWLARHLNTAGIRAWQAAPTTAVGPVGTVAPPLKPWLLGWTAIPTASWPAAIRATSPSEVWQEPGGTGVVLLWESGFDPLRMVYVGPTSSSSTFPAGLSEVPGGWTSIGANVQKCLLFRP